MSYAVLTGEKYCIHVCVRYVAVYLARNYRDPIETPGFHKLFRECNHFYSQNGLFLKATVNCSLMLRPKGLISAKRTRMGGWVGGGGENLVIGELPRTGNEASMLDSLS